MKTIIANIKEKFFRYRIEDWLDIIFLDGLHTLFLKQYKILELFISIFEIPPFFKARNFFSNSPTTSSSVFASDKWLFGNSGASFIS